MQLEPEFLPVASADSWQLSNPPILAMAPLRTSFAIFDEAGGMAALRAKSLQLTGYLEFLLDRAPSQLFTVITPVSLTNMVRNSRFLSTNIRKSYLRNSRLRV
jgi:kynureninase